MPQQLTKKGVLSFIQTIRLRQGADVLTSAIHQLLSIPVIIHIKRK